MARRTEGQFIRLINYQASVIFNWFYYRFMMLFDCTRPRKIRKKQTRLIQTRERAFASETAETCFLMCQYLTGKLAIYLVSECAVCSQAGTSPSTLNSSKRTPPFIRNIKQYLIDEGTH